MIKWFNEELSEWLGKWLNNLLRYEWSMVSDSITSFVPRKSKTIPQDTTNTSQRSHRRENRLFSLNRPDLRTFILFYGYLFIRMCSGSIVHYRTSSVRYRTHNVTQICQIRQSTAFPGFGTAFAPYGLQDAYHWTRRRHLITGDEPRIASLSQTAVSTF